MYTTLFKGDCNIAQNWVSFYSKVIVVNPNFTFDWLLIPKEICLILGMWFERTENPVLFCSFYLHVLEIKIILRLFLHVLEIKIILRLFLYVLEIKIILRLFLHVLEIKITLKLFLNVVKIKDNCRIIPTFSWDIDYSQIIPTCSRDKKITPR